jgi:toxin YoeB
MRFISFVPEAWEQYTFWHGQDRKTLKRINLLIEAAARDPLVGNLSGYWSRRIDETNRLVYRATDDEIRVIGCRYHYDA